MNIAIAYNAQSIHNVEQIFYEKNAMENFKLASILGIRTEIKKDALQAVKLDPAVIEAQVTIDLKQNKFTRKIPTYDQNNAIIADNNNESLQSYDSFGKIISTQLKSLSPNQFELLLNYSDTIRRQKLASQNNLVCAFCKNNGEPVTWYSSHALKDKRGKVRCPVLRAFHCPRCGATGDRAHTIKYCPKNIAGRWDRF